MKDAQGDPVQGRIRWRRFAAVALPAAAAAGAIVVGMATGAIAAQFSVSGQAFKVSAASLDGSDFVQYGGRVNTTQGGDTWVATSGIADATLVNLCQSVAPKGFGVSMMIRAGRSAGSPVHATNLVINMTDLRGEAKFDNIDIGVDAGTLDGSGKANGMFGQQAKHVHIDNLQQTALTTSAGTFELKGLHLYLDAGSNPEECFPTDTSK